MDSIIDQQTALARIQARIEEIRIWMILHKLMMNDSKTEFVIVVSSGSVDNVSIDTITIGDSSVSPSGSARNIGVIFDATLCLNDHITKSCPTCHYWLNNTRRIRRCLSLTATQLLVQALVLSRLDYCNALYYVGLHQQRLGRLQRIKNADARLVTCIPRQEHISPVLMQLHWLKVPQWIIFKIPTLTFLAIHGKAPTYICELVEQHTLRRELRSTSNAIMLKQPRFRRAAGDRAFVTAAPRLWNCLPADIRAITTTSSISKHLKTYLFNEGYKELQ